MRHALIWPLVCLSAALAAPAAFAADAAPAGDDGVVCGPIDLGPSQRDYRERDSSQYLRSYLNDVNSNHYEPAMRRIHSGSYSQPVIADLDYTLRIWPNHIPALQAMIQYEIGGGKLFEFYPVSCYFARARKFAPDDESLILLEAYYRWKKGDPERAKGLYESALAMKPDSADAHYNLGLIYFEAGQYDKANEHAHAAYAAGYPLPGLRKLLQKSGHWKDLAKAAAN